MALSLDFSSNQPAPSAQFANPTAPFAAGQAIHNGIENAKNALGFGGTDFSQGQFTPNAYASGPNQNYSANNNVPGPSASMNTGGGAPPMPTAGQYPNVGTIQNGYRWNGKGWDPSGPTGQQSQPQVDQFAQMIQPAIDSFESLIGQQQGLTQGNIANINQGRQAALGSQQTQQQGQEASLNQQTTQQTNAANNAVDEAQRMYAEMSQGIQARYGGTTGTGAFINEQLGQQTGRNVALLRQGLAQNLQDINDKMTQVKSAGADAVNQINTNYDGLIQQAQDKLQGYMTQIRQNEGMLQAQKAQMAQQAMEFYQSQAANIQAQRQAETDKIAMGVLQAQTTLQAYGQKATGILGSLNNVNFGDILNQGISSNSQIANTQAPTLGQDRGSFIPNWKINGQ